MSGSRCFDKSLVLRDGVKLISRIWLPNSNGPWPALLMRQPYGREIASTIKSLSLSTPYELERKISRLERILRVKNETDTTFNLLKEWIKKASQIDKSI